VILKRVEGVFQVSTGVGKRTRRDFLGVGKRGRLTIGREHVLMDVRRGGALRRFVTSLSFLLSETSAKCICAVDYIVPHLSDQSAISIQD